MDKIVIEDLAVFYCVGVPEAERAQPQRLLLTIEMTHEFSAAAVADDVCLTIDYYAVSQRLLSFGKGRRWKLIEKLAVDLAEMILAEFQPSTVTVAVKKFAVSEARHVAVQVTRSTVGTGSS